MQLSFDILDHIFSFLVSHRDTLIACSKDPVLLPIVERYLYYHLIVHFGEDATMTDHAFEIGHLFKLVTENPSFLRRVRILQIQVDTYFRYPDLFDDVSKTLLLFPALECILFNFPSMWILPDVIRPALEDRLNLSTTKGLHLSPNIKVPLSIFDNCKNLKNLSLSGEADGPFSTSSSSPQLHSLTLLGRFISDSLLAWLKLHIRELRSLRCALIYLEDLFAVCSATLNELDVDIQIPQYSSTYMCLMGEIHNTLGGLPDFYTVLPNLEQLTLRTAVTTTYDGHASLYYRLSWLPAAAEIINLFVSSLQHLILDVELSSSDLTHMDWSPLAVLGTASRSIPHIDLYVHTGIPSSALMHAKLLNSLEEVMKSIKAGVLVLHSEETAPNLFE